MASLGDLTLFVSAETKRAQQDIQGLGKEADKVTGKKREFDFSLDKARNGIRDFKRDLETIGKTAKATYKVAKMEGLFDDEIESAELLVKKTKQVGTSLNQARKPGELLNKTFKDVAGSTISVVNGLAKVGFALYGLQQITGVLQQAFGGLFNNTIGRAVRLQESILKTQTALASTNDVLRNGKVITDPYKAIVALTGVIEKRIESIRQRSLDLAGVTSGEVIEVFGIVASQAGQIGASLEEAEDLAIKFAAALGTFGLPIQQARQEIGSILRGDVGPDSYLAKSLGIRSADIKKAKNEVGGLVAFVNKKLEAAVAGQEIAARSFSGVASNIADFSELIGEAFGKPLVQPLIDGLTVVYDFLVQIKDAALGGATAIGESLATALSSIGTLVKSGPSSSIYDSLGFQPSNDQSTINSKEISKSFDSLKVSFDAFIARIQDATSKFIQIVGKGISKLAKGFANLASAFVGLNVGIFETLLTTLTNIVDIFAPLITAIADFVAVYGEFLRLPIVQTLSNIGAQLQLMEKLGVNAFIKLTLVSVALIKSFGTLKAVVIGLVGSVKGALVAGLTLVASGLKALQAILTPFIVSLGAANPALAVFAANLNKTAAGATAAAAGLKTTAGATTVLTKATIRFLKFNLILLAVTVAVAALIELFNKFRRAADRAAKIDDFDDNIKKLNTSLSETAVEGNAAQEALRSVAEAQALAAVNLLKKEFVDAASKVNELEKSIKDLEEQTKSANFLIAFFVDPAGSLRRELARMKNAQKELHEAKIEYIDKEADFAKLKDKERLEESIETQGKNLNKLSEELAKATAAYNEGLRRREVTAQQDLSKRRIQLFQVEEDLRIRQLEARNLKLIEGEEGASAAALTAFNKYISEKERGELDLEAQKRELLVANADVEEQIANYKYDLEQKILELKKKGLKVAAVEAELAEKKKEAEEAKLKLKGIEEETTTSPTAADLGLGSAEGFAGAKRAAQDISRKILNNQALSQGFVDQQNLDNIVTQLLPNVSLEGFKNSIEESSALITELGKGLPIEAAKNNAQAFAQNEIRQREVNQTLEHLREELAEHPNIYAYLEEEIQKRYNGKGGILEQLRDEAVLRAAANEKQRQANSIMGLQESTRQGNLQTEQNLITQGAGMQAGVEVDLFQRNRILAEGRINSRRAELEQDGPMTADVQAEFQEFSEQELFNADRQAEMDGMIQRFERLGSVASGVGDAISTAFTQGFADIITGTSSVQDVLGNMFKSIGQSFMKLAQQIIADMIKMLIFKSLLGLFGGGTMPGGVGMGAGNLGGGTMQSGMFGGTFGAIGPNFGIPQGAKGGIVSAPTVAMVGEGSMNEAIVPMPDGKAIPVDIKGLDGAGGGITSNVTVNVNNEGKGNSEMNGDGAGKLGKAIDSAIRKVIMDERRSGGLLYQG